VAKGPIVEVDYRNPDDPAHPRPVVLPADPDSKKYKLPVVMLVNGSSASASEVLTAALRDYGVATVVGEKTFGKGVVQQVTPMETAVQDEPDGHGGTKKVEEPIDALAITVGKYYTPHREEIHKIGITPDVYYDIQNQLKDDPKLQDLQKKIEAKADELRQLRAEANTYLRANDAQKDRAEEVAKELAAGKQVDKVAQIKPPQDDHSAMLEDMPGLTPKDGVKPGDDSQGGTDSKSDGAAPQPAPSGGAGK
jgi:C-terminal processing protease CtpA/Prc